MHCEQVTLPTMQYGTAHTLTTVHTSEPVQYGTAHTLTTVCTSEPVQYGTTLQYCTDMTGFWFVK